MAKTKVHGEFLKDSVVRFTAKAGENITKGQAVYISGISGEVPVVSLADADDTAKMPAFGLAEATVSTNAEVEITSFGTLKGLDTSSYSLGDILYVHTTAGSLTNNPSGLEATKLQNIGIVQRVHASSGSIKVGGAGRTNAVPNLDDGDIFIGDSNNKAISDSFTNVLNTEAGINSSANATAITIDSSEQVGIGGSPDTPLTVSVADNTIATRFKGTNGIFRVLPFETGLGVKVTALNGNESAFETLAYQGADHQFVIGTAEKMRIDSSGAVGIGQVPETARFSGHDILQVGGRATLLGNDTVTATGQTVLLDNLYYDASGNFQHRGDSRGVAMQFYEGQVIFSNSNQTTGTPTVSERMRIDSSGNIGIGASSITDKLEVVTAGSSSTENALRLTNPFGFGGLGNGAALVFAQDRSDAENYPMAKIQSYQSSANSSNEGDLDIYTRSGGSLGVRASFLSGGGIAFNGDRSQSNALDDYEEGTFTPTVNSGGITTSWAKYTKIGDTVFIACEINLTSTRSSSDFIVSGLPFTNGNAWTPCSFYAQYYNNEGTQQASGVFKASSDEFLVHDFGGEAAGTDFGNGYFNFAGTYKIN